MGRLTDVEITELIDTYEEACWSGRALLELRERREAETDKDAKIAAYEEALAKYSSCIERIDSLSRVRDYGESSVALVDIERLVADIMPPLSDAVTRGKEILDLRAKLAAAVERAGKAERERGISECDRLAATSFLNNIARVLETVVSGIPLAIDVMIAERREVRATITRLTSEVEGMRDYIREMGHKNGCASRDAMRKFHNSLPRPNNEALVSVDCDCGFAALADQPAKEQL